MTRLNYHACFKILSFAACGAIWFDSGIACAVDARLHLLFTSQGKSARINVDGSGLKYFDFPVPNQATWQPGPIFPDGKRVILLSMEPRRDVAGKPFDEYYTQTPTRLWLHNLATGDLTEICTKERLAVFVTPALLLGNDRLLVQVVRDRIGQIYNVRMDGADAREFTQAGEGLHPVHRGEAHLDARACREHAGERGHADRLRRITAGGDGEFALLATAHLAQAGVQGAEAGQQVASIGHQRAAEVGLLDALVASQEQHAAQPMFQRRDLPRQRRLAVRVAASRANPLHLVGGNASDHESHRVPPSLCVGPDG